MADYRYVALDRLTYARALVVLTSTARTWTGPSFRYGPLAITQLEQAGLEVSGPELSAVLDILDRVPGLVRWPLPG